MVAGRVVRESALISRRCYLDAVHERRRITGYLLRSWIARGKDIEPLVTVQAEFHGHALAGFHLVDHRQVVNRLEETGEIEGLHIDCVHALRTVREPGGEGEPTTLESRRPQAKFRDGFAVEQVIYAHHSGNPASEVNSGFSGAVSAEERNMRGVGAHRAETSEGGAGDGGTEIGNLDGIRGEDASASFGFPTLSRHPDNPFACGIGERKDNRFQSIQPRAVRRVGLIGFIGGIEKAIGREASGV